MKILTTPVLYDDSIERGKRDRPVAGRVESGLMSLAIWFGVAFVLWRMLAGERNPLIFAALGVGSYFGVQVSLYFLSHSVVKVDAQGVLVPRGGTYLRARYVRFEEVAVALVGSATQRRLHRKAVLLMRHGWSVRREYSRSDRDVLAVLDLREVRNPRKLLQILKEKLPLRDARHPDIDFEIISFPRPSPP